MGDDILATARLIYVAHRKLISISRRAWRGLILLARVAAITLLGLLIVSIPVIAALVIFHMYQDCLFVTPGTHTRCASGGSQSWNYPLDVSLRFLGVQPALLDSSLSKDEVISAGFRH